MTSSAGQRISCNVVETRRDDVARIFNIQRYSLNDGEGIRTVVFFKGCPHLCPWCANPESISGKIQTVRREAKCLHCAKLCDEVLFDLKIMDATQARDVVKMNLPRVLENLRLLVSEGVNVIPRLPLIPGFTLSRENMQQALDVLTPLKIRQIHLLPFHQYGEPKYRLLGKTWSMKEVPAPSSADVTTMREMAERAGFQVTVGG
ncbi:4Fe-4S cluster-binding domain-containing protein [Shigella flexneri]|nr:4Fe-4S cluster-binding domain-containing protein [Escherichia coli]